MTLNNLDLEKTALQSKSLLSRKTLFLTEIYESIQGESQFAGFPTLFIRLAGCHLRCSWCDTPHSFARGQKYALDSLYREISTYGSKHVCITGGEPLLQETVYELMTFLCTHHYSVSLETSGSKSIEKVDPRVHIILDLKCPSSGMEEHNLFVNLKHLRAIDEIKFVIATEEDYHYALQICKEHALFGGVAQVLFSPEFEQMPAKKLTEWILRDTLPVKLNLQLHKYIWSSTTQGV